MTNKQALWQEYFKAVKSGRATDAKDILSRIHRIAPAKKSRGGGCSRCKKRFN